MKNVKRVVNTGFWDDDLVLNEFSPEDKYFMLYLLTNQYTTQLGIYHLPIKKASLELGYSVESIIVLLDRFENKYKLIKYSKDTSEVAIKNYLKHSIIKGGKPVMDCLLKEENAVKDKCLLAYIYTGIKDSDVALNETVNEYIKHLYIYINNKDNYNTINENERIVHESSTNRTTNRDIDTLRDNFELIYKEYPVKKGKARGFEIYRQWLKGRKINGSTIKISNKDMWSAVVKYRKECEAEEKEQQYIKHFDTFMNKAILDYL